jgi:hypothetical protein
MKRTAGWLSALVVTLVCVLALFGMALPAVAIDTISSMELWLNADGSGEATMIVYLPPGGPTADEMVSSMEGETYFSDASQKSLGGDQYEITFKWSDFAAAFGSDWTDLGETVEVDLGNMGAGSTEVILHLPGTILQQEGGTKVDDFTLSFKGSGSTSTFSFSKTASPLPTATAPPTATKPPTAALPSATSPPTPKPTASGTFLGLSTQWWIIGVAGLGVLLLAVLVLVLILRSGQGRRQVPAAPYLPPVAGPPPALCPTCGSTLVPGKRFCEYCGADSQMTATPPVAPPVAPPATPPATFCPSCGRQAIPGQRFCQGCGNAIPGGPA